MTIFYEVKNTMVEDIKTLWFDFLKALTRSIVQINLYKPEHPQVISAIEDVTAALAKIFNISDELALTLDNDKLIVNNTPLLTSNKIPNSIKNVFLKFNIQSITFLKGLSAQDIKTFCKMQYAKTEPLKYLQENNIDKIILNKDIYTKTGSAAPTEQTKPSSVNTAAQIQKTETVPGKSITKEIEENFKIEAALNVLASKATDNENEREVIVNLLMKKVKAEIEQEIKTVIDAHRREKRKLNNDMGRTESVVSSMGDGIVTINKTGKIIMMNKDAETMSGKSLKEISGKQIFDISNLENQILTLAQEIGSEDKKDISKDISQKGRKDIAETIKKSTTIIQNEDGKIVGAVSIPTDETKLKQMEKLKEDFISNMTHELRSPLTSIKAALELLSKEKKVADSSKNILSAAIRNSNRLAALINDILDFSKLESGKMIFHSVPISPVEIAQEAIDSMNAWAKSKGISLLQINEDNLPEIYTDKRKTVQILINLISNALKFTPTGGKIELSIDLGKEKLANSVFFSVKDTGCGIKKENQAKVFDKFAQIASGEKIKGTGLGLSITKALVVLQDGKINLESEYGKGSTFRISMPVYKRQINQQDKETSIENEKSWWRNFLGI